MLKGESLLKLKAESSKLKVERLQINQTTNDVSAVPNL
ncbi:hypothetical protein D3OALGB2SA_4435 [Olavius algarvensis associated proteobacterium Delta 3]|nr:hypothetical protein D3OALGB2SA_4435 [Olavius algarvensis associated proteobacterium Delta 3]